MEWPLWLNVALWALWVYIGFALGIFQMVAALILLVIRLCNRITERWTI